MSKIIALDESTKSTGYAVFENNKLIDKGAIVQSDKDTLKRINNMLNSIRDLIEYHEPDIVVIENVQITMSAPTAKYLMGLQTIIELLCYRMEIKCVSVRTAHWRKVLGLSNSPKMKRQEKKKQAMEYCKNKYHIETAIDDVTDAICIGDSYLKENTND